MLTEMFKNEGDSWERVEFCTISDAELDRKFDSEYGAQGATDFTLWTRDHVYRNAEYDGADYLFCLPRNHSHASGFGSEIS